MKMVFASQAWICLGSGAGKEDLGLDALQSERETKHGPVNVSEKLEVF